MKNPYVLFLPKNIPYELFPKNYIKYENHLLKLNKEDRNSRFGYPISTSGIKNYISTLNKEKDIIIGIEDEENENIIAAAHLALIKHEGEKIIELGLSVNENYRGKGLGNKLFKHTINKARNRGYNLLETQCLTNNTWMMKKAEKEKMILARDGLEATGKIKLAGPHFMTHFSELNSSNQRFVKNMFDTYFKVTDPFSYLPQN
ncbi:MAG: GNAT family N-acetyltransferase [Nanoarchaeota archaeon]|nr:GNAT family N-acetyltransferase [Nanoarchaeota archaeon]